MYRIWVLFILIPFFINAQPNSPTRTRIMNEIRTAFNDRDYNQILKLGKQLVSIDSTDYEAYYELARGEYQLLNEKQALYYINRAIQFNSIYYESYLLKAFIFYRINDYETCITNAMIYADNIDKKAGALELIGRSYVNMGEHKKAKEYFQKILNFEEQNVSEWNKKMALVGIAKSLRVEGKCRKSLIRFDKLHKQYPNDLIIIEERGFTYMQMKKYEKAYEAFHRMLIGEENIFFQSFGYNNQGFARFRMGQIEEGLVDINKSLELNPDNSHALRNKAIIYIQLGRKEEACDLLEQAKTARMFTGQIKSEIEVLIKKNCKEYTPTK